MTDPACLQHEARRAYEQGRFWAALRVGLVVVPIAAICARETAAPWRTMWLAGTLLVVATAIRWRQVHGFEIVTAGLRSGAMPLGAALALCRFAPACPPQVALAVCGGAGLLAGLAIGGALDNERPARWQHWTVSALVGGLMAALGCLALGIGSALGAAFGIAVGAAIAAGRRGATT